MIIDLNEKAPHVDVKLGNKTYQVFANDKNTQVLDDLYLYIQVIKAKLLN
jgi:hypothetical protein